MLTVIQVKWQACLIVNTVLNETAIIGYQETMQKKWAKNTSKCLCKATAYARSAEMIKQMSVQEGVKAVLR